MANERAPVFGEDIRMMKEGQWWPRVLVLPLRRWRRGDSPGMGYLTAETGFRVYLGNIYGYRDPRLGYIEYATAEECYADGWRVD
jgi:hypothetical protein